VTAPEPRKTLVDDELLARIFLNQQKAAERREEDRDDRLRRDALMAATVLHENRGLAAKDDVVEAAGFFYCWLSEPS
jgi:hypothetical protein